MKNTLFIFTVLALMLYSCNSNTSSNKDISTNKTEKKDQKQNEEILPEVNQPAPMAEEPDQKPNKNPNLHKGTTPLLKDIVSDIRSKFKKVNTNLSNYKKVHKDMDDESTEGGELIAYYDNAKLYKIEAIYYGETYNRKFDYYLWAGRLFFIFEKVNKYDKPVYTENTKVIETEENRYYIYKNKIVKWIGPDKKEVDKSKFESEGTELIKRLEKFKAVLSSK
jgi:hypothetical protein